MKSLHRLTCRWIRNACGVTVDLLHGTGKTRSKSVTRTRGKTWRQDFAEPLQPRQAKTRVAASSTLHAGDSVHRELYDNGQNDLARQEQVKKRESRFRITSYF